MADEQQSDITFDERDEFEAQLGPKDAAELEKADHFAREQVQIAIMRSLSAASAAYVNFEQYVKQKAKKEGKVFEDFGEAGELVGDLVEVASECEDILPVFGTVMKHFSLAALRAANEHESLIDAAGAIVAGIEKERDQAAAFAPQLLEEHAMEIRNAYAGAKGEVTDREKAVTHVLSSLGLGVPPVNAGAQLYGRLVERVNVDAWIESCRSGKNGKTAACASDSELPKFKQEGKDEEKKYEMDGADEKKKDAIPRG
jgi:hypothetical protein